MSAINILTGPSSWDRDMQGLDLDEESENLAALGMHLAGAKDDEEEEEDEASVEAEIDGAKEEEEDEEEDEVEELDELKELERLEQKLQEEDEPALLVDEEE